MNVALATYGDRIASLFESSDRFIIFDSRSDPVEKPRTLTIRDNSTSTLLQQLKANETNVLICGAICGCDSQILESQGIQVIPWIKGPIKDVMEAYRMRQLFSPGFMMPGCRRRGRRGHHWHGSRTDRN